MEFAPQADSPQPHVQSNYSSWISGTCDLAWRGLQPVRGQWLRHGCCQSIDTIYHHELGQNVDKPWYCAICGSPNLLDTETWLDPSIPNSEILPSLNNVYRKDGGGKVGGVLTAVLNTLDSSAAPELEDEGCELLWVRVKLKGRRTLYLCAYCRPSAADETSLRKLGQSLERASQVPKAHLLIGGDFNFQGWDWQTTTPTLKSRAPYPAFTMTSMTL